MIPTLLPAALQPLERTIGVWTYQERVSLVVRPFVGLLLVLLIHALVRHSPWPRPFRLRFLALHVVAAPTVAVLWIVGSRLAESLFLGWGTTVPYEEEFIFIGCLGYTIAAGILYSVENSARAARAESAAARTQLAALRSQLHPHFLFNALHTVVQLIPANPALAMEAAEIVAELLRASLEEQRDELSLAEEWRFVSRYLTVERIRFGDRLTVTESLAPESMSATLPAFALQTLVENAVRHGAAPRVDASTIHVEASGGADGTLRVAVRNPSGGDAGSGADALAASTGTGLARLRERLSVLYGNAATLTTSQTADSYEATLVIPQGRRAP